MLSTLTIEVNFEWRQELPEEECTCANCHETIFFKRWSLYMHMLNQWTKDKEIALCDSCHSLLEETEKR